MHASLGERADGDSVMIHTAVPIADETGATVDRLFIYSEKPE
jgi:hypothetical protein